MAKDSTSVKLINLAIDYHKPSVLIESDWWLLICLSLLILLTFLLFKYVFKHKHHVSQVNVEMFGATFTIVRSYENLYIANRIYIELITRKAALPFDEENDVIEEVYDSLYKLFGIIRDEIKSVPGQYLISHDPTKALIGLSTKILNTGLRPHLTEYHAKYRKWLKNEKEKADNQNLSPQALQKLYPDYTQLIDSLKLVNQTLQNYAGELNKLIST